MERDMIYAILGILGGIFTASGDMLLDIKSKDNKKLGKYRIIDSYWDNMNVNRFKNSILLASIGVPMIALGMISMAHQIGKGNAILGEVFFYTSLGIVVGGLFIHILICVLPVIYKTMRPQCSFDDAEKVINAVYDAIKIPFWIYYIIGVIAPSGIIIWSLFAGYLKLSPWFTLLTIIPMFASAIFLDKLKHDWFYDLPNIIVPSLSLSCIGLMSFLNQIM